MLFPKTWKRPPRVGNGGFALRLKGGKPAPALRVSAGLAEHAAKIQHFSRKSKCPRASCMPPIVWTLRGKGADDGEKGVCCQYFSGISLLFQNFCLSLHNKGTSPRGCAEERGKQMSGAILHTRKSPAYYAAWLIYEGGGGVKAADRTPCPAPSATHVSPQKI